MFFSSECLKITLFLQFFVLFFSNWLCLSLFYFILFFSFIVSYIIFISTVPPPPPSPPPPPRLHFPIQFIFYHYCFIEFPWISIFCLVMIAYLNAYYIYKFSFAATISIFINFPQSLRISFCFLFHACVFCFVKDRSTLFSFILGRYITRFNNYMYFFFLSVQHLLYYIWLYNSGFI